MLIRWSSSPSRGFEPGGVSALRILSVQPVGGRTVAVQPGLQTVDANTAGETFELITPGVVRGLGRTCAAISCETVRPSGAVHSPAGAAGGALETTAATYWRPWALAGCVPNKTNATASTAMSNPYRMAARRIRAAYIPPTVFNAAP